MPCNRTARRRMKRKKSDNDAGQSKTPRKQNNGGPPPSYEKPPFPSLSNVFVGCAGFANSGWIGPKNFYPPKLVGSDSLRQLNHYQQHLDAVEINSTFYGVPSENTVRQWKSKSSPSFRVVLKTPKSVTHENSTGLDAEAFARFLQRALLLEKNLAVILVQCPARLRVDTSQLTGLYEVTKSLGYGGRVAVELRHPDSLSDASVMRALKEWNWSCVYHPNTAGRATVGNSAAGRDEGGAGPGTDGALVQSQYRLEDLSDMFSRGRPPLTASDFVYVRLHGDNDRHQYDYTVEELDRAARQVHAWRRSGLEVYVFLLNDLAPNDRRRRDGSSTSSLVAKRKSSSLGADWSAMPGNAVELRRRIHALATEESGVSPPPPPKQPPKTLTQFFGVKKPKT